MSEQTPFRERVGVFHVHSRYSDGSACLAGILAAARATGLDFVALADHDSLAARREGWEGRHGDMVLLAAAEITPAHAGHVVAMNVDRCIGFAARHNRSTLDDIAAQGGYAIVAHPMGKNRPSLRIHHKPWYDWDHPAVRGMEIWSYTHDWVDGVVWWRLPYAYEFWKHPERRVAGPCAEVLRQWDRMGRRRRVAGFGGLDCHGRIVPLAGVQIFPYEKMFRCLRNHLFIREEDWRADPRRALWEAHAEGRGLVSHHALADAAGSRCFALLPDSRRVEMGEEAAFVPGAATVLDLPRPADIRWIADGECRLAAHAARLEARPAGPGVYRFEARLDGWPWVFTNPIYFR